MSNVELAIGGRSYTLACDPGEEAHIRRLGQSIDARLSTVAGITSQSEVRRLLYAALLLADELHETQAALAAAQDGADAEPEPEPGRAQLAEMLETLAGRMEGLAARLET